MHSARKKNRFDLIRLSFVLFCCFVLVEWTTCHAFSQPQFCANIMVGFKLTQKLIKHKCGTTSLQTLSRERISFTDYLAGRVQAIQSDKDYEPTHD